MRSRLATWRTARPQSTLARLAGVQMWTDAAWSARGNDYADTITPQMSAKVDALLQKSAASLKSLPPTVFKSPLGFMVAIDCSLLAGAPREAMISCSSPERANSPIICRSIAPAPFICYRAGWEKRAKRSH